MQRKPPWVKIKSPDQSVLKRMQTLTDKWGVHTICKSAVCPNAGDCFAQGTATFLILGDICTRECRFCAVPKGKLLPPDADEPMRIAFAIRELALDYVVITSVTRDDLKDGGSAHYAAVIRAIKKVNKDIKVEALVPDFGGDHAACAQLVEAGLSVCAHNIETVPRLYPLMRRGADYRRSLGILRCFKRLAPDADVLTKSSIILGLGETREEILSVMRDLRRTAACDIITLGQYLQPSTAQLPVQRYLTPDEFIYFEKVAEQMGFAAVVSGTFVRSSYRAADIYRELCAR